MLYKFFAGKYFIIQKLNILNLLKNILQKQSQLSGTSNGSVSGTSECNISELVWSQKVAVLCSQLCDNTCLSYN